jgi:hypothetical protein
MACAMHVAHDRDLTRSGGTASPPSQAATTACGIGIDDAAV